MSINTISFHTDGTAHCLWTEAVPLHEIGQLDVNRASTIEFNNSTQLWEVRDLEGKTQFMAKSRSLCLTWEHQHFDGKTS